MSLQWEVIVPHDNQETERLKVFKGWVVRTKVNSKPPCVAMSFVPDPDHEWTIPEEEEKTEF